MRQLLGVRCIQTYEETHRSSYRNGLVGDEFLIEIHEKQELEQELEQELKQELEQKVDHC